MSQQIRPPVRLTGTDRSAPGGLVFGCLSDSTRLDKTIQIGDVFNKLSSYVFQLNGKYMMMMMMVI